MTFGTKNASFVTIANTRAAGDCQAQGAAARCDEQFREWAPHQALNAAEMSQESDKRIRRASLCADEDAPDREWPEEDHLLCIMMTSKSCEQAASRLDQDVTITRWLVSRQG